MRSSVLGLKSHAAVRHPVGVTPAAQSSASKPNSKSRRSSSRESLVGLRWLQPWCPIS